MKFDSDSVIMKGKAINYRYPVETPPVFKHYKFQPDVLREAVEEFNQRLDKRPRVTMHFDHIKVDVLRLVPTSDDTLAIWLVVKEKDMDTVHETKFTIKGDVYFEGDSDVKVDKMVIKDVMYSEDKGIFTRKQLTASA
jgi:hypothetical protein